MLTERLGDSPFAGLWEFPGGKIRDRETAPEALRRELLEELGITIELFEYLMSVNHHYPDRHVAIDFYIVRQWQSNPRGLEGQALRWEVPESLGDAEVLPADVPVLQALRADPIRPADKIRKY